MGTNRFLAHAFCPGDLKRIVEEGSWLLRGYALMPGVYDGATQVPTVISNKVQVWAQIRMIPTLYCTKDIFNQLAVRVGEVVDVNMRVEECGDGDFQRVRVNLSAYTPLTRFVTLAPEDGDPMFFEVKFEKSPKFCAHCGQMGHMYLDCGYGEYVLEELQYGEWIIAPSNTWRVETPRMRFNQEAEQPRGEWQGRGGRGGRTTGRTSGGGRVGRGGRNAKEGLWKEKQKGDGRSTSRK